jgi:hypothetical protein
MINFLHEIVRLVSSVKITKYLAAAFFAVLAVISGLDANAASSYRVAVLDDGAR